MKIVPDAVNALLKSSALLPGASIIFVVRLAALKTRNPWRANSGSKLRLCRIRLRVIVATPALHMHCCCWLAPWKQQTRRADYGGRLGQGCDVLLFRATDALAQLPAGVGLKACLANRREEENYFKFLAFNGLITMEHGLRAETDKNTGLSTAYRNRDLTTGFIGGKCRKCGTEQIPAAQICVNPQCGSVGTQEPHPFADAIAALNSYTSDRLTYSINPPAYYGMIQFSEGGRIMIDFADVVPEQGLEVGMSMRMVFRVRDYDHKRGFRRYYWKRRLSIWAVGSKPWLVGLEIRSPFLAWAAPDSASAGIANAEDLMVEAYTEALADAGIETSDIDAAWLATALDEQHVGNRQCR